MNVFNTDGPGSPVNSVLSVRVTVRGSGMLQKAEDRVFLMVKTNQISVFCNGKLPRKNISLVKVTVQLSYLKQNVTSFMA